MAKIKTTEKKSKKLSTRLPAILEVLGALARSASARLATDFTARFSETQTAFENAAKPGLERTTSAATGKIDYWQEFVALLHDLQRYQQSVQQFDPAILISLVRDEWQKAFDDTMAELPATKTVTLSDTLLQIREDDPLKTRLWKHTTKIRAALRSFFEKFTTRRRSDPETESAAQTKATRKFYLRHFFKVHYDLPVRRFLIQLWQEYLRQMAVQVYDLSCVMEEMVESLFAAKGNTFSEMDSRTENEIRKVYKKLRSDIETVKDGVHFDPQERVERFLSELQQNIETVWPYRATWLHPNREHSEAKFTRQQNEIQSDFDRQHKSWLRHFEAEHQELQKTITLYLLLGQAVEIFLETVTSLAEKNREKILPAFDEPLNLLSQSLSKFSEMTDTAEHSLHKAILDENRIMLRNLRREKLPVILDVFHQAQREKSMQNYISRINHEIEKLPEAFVVFDERDLEHMPPRSKTDEIPFKDLVQDEMYSNLNEQHEAFAQSLEEKQQRVYRDVSEIDQIVEFNLEAALDLLNEKEDEPVDLLEARSVVIEGLERAKNQLESLKEKNEEIVESCRTALSDNTSDFLKQAQELADHDRLLELKLRYARARAREEFREHRSKLLQRIKSMLPALVTAAGATLQRVRTSYFKFRKITGLAPVTRDVDRALSDFLTRTQERLSTLPYVYQRLFRFEPLTDERFFGGRENELNLLRDRFQAWQKGEAAMTALVGEKGSGRTTLLHFAKNQIYTRTPVLKIDLMQTVFTESGLLHYLKQGLQMPEAEDIDDLETRIRQRDDRRICIVENFHNLFLRTVDGFEALTRFLLFMSQTQNRIYWLTTCGLYAWHYLDRVVDLSRSFHDVVFLSELDIENIEQVILKRHRVSGYKLEFEAPENIGSNRKYKRLLTEEARQDYLREHFFDELSKLALGNITVAILFWLRAIKEVSGDKLILSPEIEFDPSFLEQLPAEDLFTFAAFLQHETLTPEQHARIFHHGIQKSLLMFNRLRSRGILIETPNGYQIHYLLYRPIVRTLKIRNILY